MPRIADSLDLAMEKRFRLLAAALVLFLLVCGVVEDLRSKMWVDELYTLHMAGQANPREIVQATMEGCDGAPPLYSLIVQSVVPWIRNDALAVRLPSTLGYCAMLVCVLAFCRPRFPAAYALLAAMLAFLDSGKYLTEGRSYGLQLGAAAGALLAWQRAVEGRRRILAIPVLAFCLALMTALHYYSVFFIVPLVLAEMMRWRGGKPDFAILAAFASPLPVLAIHYPLIAASRQAQQHFWSPAVFSAIPLWYSTFLLQPALVAAFALAAFSILPQGRRAPATGLTKPEWVATGTLAAMPFCVVVISKFTTHAFVDRYTLWAVIGIAILVPAIIAPAARRKPAVGAGVLAVLAFLIFAKEVRRTAAAPHLAEGEAVFQALQLLPDGAEPIVVADHHVFMELSYYAPPQIRDRLIYPLSRSLDLRYFGSDTGSLLMTALRRRSTLPVVPYEAVLAAHPAFILAALPRDYLPWHLAKSGYRVVPLDIAGSGDTSSMPPALYRVEAAENSSGRAPL
jgi:hypothetical protein